MSDKVYRIIEGIFWSADFFSHPGECKRPWESGSGGQRAGAEDGRWHGCACAGMARRLWHLPGRLLRHCGAWSRIALNNLPHVRTTFSSTLIIPVFQVHPNIGCSCGISLIWFCSFCKGTYLVGLFVPVFISCPWSANLATKGSSGDYSHWTEGACYQASAWTKSHTVFWGELLSAHFISNCSVLMR